MTVSPDGQIVDGRISVKFHVDLGELDPVEQRAVEFSKMLLLWEVMECPTCEARQRLGEGDYPLPKAFEIREGQVFVLGASCHVLDDVKRNGLAITEHDFNCARGERVVTTNLFDFYERRGK